MSQVSVLQARCDAIDPMLWAAMQQTRTQFAIRTNPLLQTVDVTLRQLSDAGFDPQAVDGMPNSFLLPIEARDALVRGSWQNDGLLYVQSLASQLAVFALDPKPNENILDLTAAPGSKTTQMAAAMQNTGRIAAVELSKSRFHKLITNCKAQAVTNVEFYCKDGSHVYKHCENQFDRVLLDAPCSSDTRMDFNDPSSVDAWSLNNVKRCVRKQKSLMHSAFRCLKPGGCLVYSTCTFAPEENEAMVQYCLDKFPQQASVANCDLPVDNVSAGLEAWQSKSYSNELHLTQRVWPTQSMPGFYIAVIKKV